MLGEWPLTPCETKAIVGDALVASRPASAERWQRDAGDHKGRPYDAVTPAANAPPKICRTPPLEESEEGFEAKGLKDTGHTLVRPYTAREPPQAAI